MNQDHLPGSAASHMFRDVPAEPPLPPPVGPAGVTPAVTPLCREHGATWIDWKDIEALARVLRWDEFTVLHACQGRFEMTRHEG